MGHEPNKDFDMPTIEVTKDTFEETIADNDVVFLDFWASWCGPCIAFGPVFETAADANPNMVFAKVNTEVEQELAASFDIRSIPTLMVFREQIMLLSQPGALQGEALDSLISQVDALDMDEVRRQIADHDHAPEHSH